MRRDLPTLIILWSVCALTIAAGYMAMVAEMAKEVP